ncbi:MAG: hypothetical protein HY308_10585 [Gammaproteobacteria bacterium]|nr:hypothetical protein [Gammaproteobacteria bacterium]
MKIASKSLVAITLLFCSFPGFAEYAGPPSAPVHLYNWWDYIAPAVTERLADFGYQTKTTTYISNEVAISRLSARQHDFDVAIVSNFALPYLIKQGLIETNQFRRTAKKRDYLPLFTDAMPHCLPYFWLTTVFVAEKEQTPNVPSSLQELVALKKQGYKIAVVDDPYETAARLIGDSNKVCGKSPDDYVGGNIFDILSNCPNAKFSQIEGLEPGDFVSALDDLLKHPKIAAYAWHGAAFMHLAKHPSLRAKVPSRPVIGYDSVCIIKRKDRKVPLGTLVKYVETLTDKKSTELNMSSNQYFSPYRNHTPGLLPPTKEIYEEVTKNLQQNRPVMLMPPSSPVHARLNEWWRSVRYAP